MIFVIFDVILRMGGVQVIDTRHGRSSEATNTPQRLILEATV